MAQTSKYKRVVLKLSGEALAGDKGFGINPSLSKALHSKLLKLPKWIVKLLSLSAVEIFERQNW